MERSRRGIAFWVLFWFAVITAMLWLLLGFLPVLAMIDGVHVHFHSLRGRWGFVGDMATGAAQASHSIGSLAQVIGDYVFSVFNLTLAVVLIRLRPKDLTARLLAIALTGTAVAFNLQGHDALQVLPPDWLGKVDAWHVSVHLISGLCYMGALILFPYGRLRQTNRFIGAIRISVMALGALVFTALLVATTEDHTTGLVIAFGVFVPVAGLSAQIDRFRKPESLEARGQSKLLIWALAIAFLVALPLILLTEGTSGGRQRTVAYEVTVPEAGVYFFRCDPHPDDMIGYVRVDASGSASPVVDMSARNNRFDVSMFQLTAGERSEIRFTNFDTDLHNIAIYGSSDLRDPIFIGAEFSGSDSGVLAFRIFRIVLGLIPIALIVGLSRFHLWDVDRVINRTLAYGVLGAAITLVYFGLIVTLGTLIGTGIGFNLAVSVALTAVLAAAFQPLRDRARRLANRLVYGKRATPYEVLSELSHRLGGTYAVDEVIPRLAEAVGEGTGAATAEVWLRFGSGLERAGSWPPGSDNGQQRLHLTALDRKVTDESQRLVPVTHRGEVLGAITVSKPPGERFTPVEDRLLHGVATQAGLVLRNAQLTAELSARLKELAASRQRLVTAQDAERRRIERDLHDGAQQNLVALSMKVQRAQELSATDGDGTASLLEEIQTDTQRTLETLRDLARGIYPPILADKGLVQALEAISRRAPIDVTVEEMDVGRVDPLIENAVYFCCLEAIQNASKHGRGPVDVRLRNRIGVLSFAITDDGPGFDAANTPAGTGLQNMIDRLAAVGGVLEIDSQPGRGTSVRGRVPHGD